MAFEAVILMALVFGATDQVVSVLPPSWSELRIVKVATANLIGIGSVFLVGATVWASEQTLGGQALSDLGGADKVVAGLLIGVGATAFNKVQSAVRNIGQNDRVTVSHALGDRSKDHGGDDPLYPIPPEYGDA